MDVISFEGVKCPNPVQSFGGVLCGPKPKRAKTNQVDDDDVDVDVDERLNN